MFPPKAGFFMFPPKAGLFMSPPEVVPSSLSRCPGTSLRVRRIFGCIVGCLRIPPASGPLPSDSCAEGGDGLGPPSSRATSVLEVSERHGQPAAPPYESVYERLSDEQKWNYELRLRRAIAVAIGRRRELRVSLTLEDVRAAARVIEGQVLVTPCLKSRTLSAIVGAEVWLKFENHQFTASFKERGALVKLASLDAAQRAAGVIAVSAGNHAQGVAFHASRLGIPAVIVMPRHTPHVKVEHTRVHGAEVILIGDDFDAAKAHALRIAEERRLTLVHPYDDPLVIAGQGTIALEMLDAAPDLDTLVVPIGGGGMISGIATAAKALRPGIEIIGAQAERFPSMRCALAGSTPVFGPSTLAEGIAVKVPGALTLEIVRRLVSDVLLVGEGDIERAILLLLEVEKTVAEGAGAVGLATLMRHRERFAGRRVGIVICGGNIDPLTLADVIQRGMVRTGRLARLTVRLRDLPGSLARVTAAIGEANANIEEVHHQRAFTNLPLQDAEVQFVLETRGFEHARQVAATIEAAGFPVVLEGGGQADAP
jgi:threonine dehydratase